MLKRLLAKLWSDDCGAVLATEYLMLGTVVSLGAATGLVSMRDAMNDEYKEFGHTIRDVRQQYSVPASKGSAGTHGGTAVTDSNQGLLPMTATP